MRNYQLLQAQTSGALPGAGLLTRFLDNWTARRAIATLDRLDEHLLRDVGYTRSDIDQALQTPLSRNAAHVLEELSTQRRRPFAKAWLIAK